MSRRERPGRASYQTAGEAMRLAADRFGDACARGALRAKDMRVFVAVLALTASYSRTEDRLTHGRIAEACGLHPKTVGKSLNVLAREGVLEYEPGRSWRFSVVRLTEATDPPVTPLLEEATDPPVAPLLDVEQEPKPSTRLPSRELPVVPSTDPPVAPTTEKDHREGPPRRTVEESYDSSTPANEQPCSPASGETGLDEEQELEQIDALAELAKLRAAIFGGEA